MQRIRKVLPFFALLTAGCLDAGPDLRRITSRHGFQMVEPGRILYFETRYNLECFDGSCAESREWGHHTQALTRDAATGKTRLLAEDSVHRLPAVFVRPFLFLPGAHRDSAIRIDGRDGSRSQVFIPYPFLMRRDSLQVYRHFLSADSRYLVARECSGSACHNAVYHHPAGTLLKRVSLPDYVNYLDEDSLALYGLAEVPFEGFTVFRHDVAVDTGIRERFAEAYLGSLKTPTGQELILYQREGKAMTYPVLKEERFNQALGGVVGMGKEVLFPLFLVDPATGEYLNETREQLFIGNLFTSKRTFLMKTYESKAF